MNKLNERNVPFNEFINYHAKWTHRKRSAVFARAHPRTNSFRSAPCSHPPRWQEALSLSLQRTRFSFFFFVLFPSLCATLTKCASLEDLGRFSRREVIGREKRRDEFWRSGAQRGAGAGHQPAGVGLHRPVFGPRCVPTSSSSDIYSGPILN